MEGTNSKGGLLMKKLINRTAVTALALTVAAAGIVYLPSPLSYLTKAEYENDYMIRYQTLLNHVFDYQNDQNAGQNKFERFEWVHKKLSPFLLMLFVLL